MAKMKIKVEHFTINRSMGESFDWKNLNIKKKMVEDLNEIGHSGKLKKMTMTIQQYFKKNLDKNGIKYDVQIIKSNNMEFTDKLLVTRVTVK